MSSWFTRTFSTPFLALLSLVLLQVSALPVHAQSSSIYSRIQQLEDDFKDLSRNFYESRLAHSKDSVLINSIDEIASQVAALTQINRSHDAIQLLYQNQQTLNNNIDSKHIFNFIELLLAHNEWHLSSVLYEAIQYEGDKTLLAMARFLFAKYHAQRNEWKQVHELLQGNISELSAENAAYANLLNGSALQYLKKHREALQSYKKIPEQSQYYSYAQLNSAIANIRQGWWTDAQLTITNYLKTSGKDNRDEMTNRLNLVLGYALLQREYYRDARDAFRRIGLNSRYTNRALLGIGLTATSQGDFVGGLNALSILKEKKTYDLSVDESYLLVPYVYEKLQQELTVSASYSEAMNYYQQRINTLNSIISQPVNFTDVEYDTTSQSLIIQKNSLDYGKHYPSSFINNYRLLITYAGLVKSESLKNKFVRSLNQHHELFREILHELIEIRQEYLKSYLNQSRYGLARLYDSSNEGKN